MQAEICKTLTAEDLRAGRVRLVCRGGFYRVEPVEPGTQLRLDVGDAAKELHRRWVDKVLESGRR